MNSTTTGPNQPPRHLQSEDPLMPLANYIMECNKVSLAIKGSLIRLDRHPVLTLLKFTGEIHRGYA